MSDVVEGGVPPRCRATRSTTRTGTATALLLDAGPAPEWIRTKRFGPSG